MRVLLIEDDPDTAAYVIKGLEEEGHTIDHTADGRDGISQAMGDNYDVLILDRMLPGLDGMAIVKTVRAAGHKVPVIFLTALGGVDDRVDGLDAGGDDYLVKPFSFSELSARVQALLRRGGGDRDGQMPTSLRLADLEVDLARRKATRAGKRLELTPKEFNLLVLLLRRRGEVLSRTVMAEQVWDINFDSETNVVEVAVRRLRAKLDEPFEVKLIHTVRGMGYVMEERPE